MSGPSVPPALTGIARSRLILAAGCAASASIFATWLLVWLIFFQTHLRVLAFASDAVGVNVPASVTFQLADAKGATPRSSVGELKALPPTDPGELIPAIAAYLKEHQGQTSIVYLASPALGSFGAAPGVVLAPVNVFRHVIKDDSLPGATLRDLLAVFQQARGKRLLILDIGRSQADSDPGAFGDDIVAQLAELARPPDRRDIDKYAAWQRDWAGFVILCSNASGQWTWTSDADGRSVFGHFVADGLRRGGEVGDLLRNIPAQVYRWVADHRGGAVQTPIVLGDTTVSFHIPIQKEPVADEPDPRLGDLARSIRDRLAQHAQRHAIYAQGGLPGLDPIAWREYRQAWLLAERFYRAGQIAAAGRLLAQADIKERTFKDPGDHDWPSLELSILVTTDPDRLAPLLAVRGSAAPGPDGAQPPTVTTTRKVRTFDEFAESHPQRLAVSFDAALKAIGRAPDPARAALVDQALRVRRLAEQAATTAPGGHPWIDRLLDQAGTERRAALDILFSGASREPVDALLQRAERRYADALKVAQATNLSNQVAADLPFLGAWLIRSQEPDRDRLAKIAELARVLANSLGRGRIDQSEPPVARLQDEANALSREFSVLQKHFGDAATLASQAESWRAVDDVLSVPTIEPGLRAKLVARSVDPTFAVALRPRVAPSTGEKGSPGMDLVRQGLNSGVTVNELGRRGYDALSDRSRDLTLIGPAPEIRPDPSFAPYQSGLALLEWSLLRIGGLDDQAVLQPLLHPVEVPGAIAQAARKARTRLIQQLPHGPESDPTARAEWERISLALPATSPDKVTANHGLARWNRLIERSADSLRHDGDAVLARRYLDGLDNQGHPSDAVRRIAQGVEAWGRPIRLDAHLAGPAVLDTAAPTPLEFAIHAPFGLPAGQVALLLSENNELRLSASADQPRDLIEIGGQTAPTTQVEVRRRDLLNRVEARAAVQSVAFFRGSQTDVSTIALDLPIVQADLAVRFVTRNLAGHRSRMSKEHQIDGKNIVDQFRGKSDEYYLYRGADTSIDAYLKCNTRATGEHPGPRLVIASASFDGKPLAVTLRGAKDKAAAIEIKEGHELIFEIGDIDTSDPKYRTKTEGSVLRFEVKADSGDILLREEVKFREITPSDYYTASAQRLAPDEVAITVRRGAGDPIAIVSKVVGLVNGGQSYLKSVQYEKMSKLGRTAGDGLDGGKPLSREAVMIHGESATFYFTVSPQENLILKAEILNDPGRSPWPLVVTPNTIPAAPVRRPERPAQPANPDDPAPTIPNP